MLLFICILSYLGLFICGIYILKKAVFKVNIFPSKILPIAIACAILSMIMFGNTARVIQFSTLTSTTNPEWIYSRYYIYRSFVTSIILLICVFLLNKLIIKRHKKLGDKIKNSPRNIKFNEFTEARLRNK